MLDAHARIQVPGRHLPANYAVLDGLRPGSSFLVRNQGHGSHGVLAMAAFALVLKDWRDVFGKRDGLGGGGTDDARLGGIEAKGRKSQEGRQGPQLKIDHNFPSLDDTAFWTPMWLGEIVGGI